MRRVFLTAVILLLGATASAKGRHSPITTFARSEARLSKLASQDETANKFCGAERDAMASLLRLTDEVTVMHRSKVIPEIYEADNDVFKLLQYCEELERIDAYSNEMLEDEPVSKRARELVSDLDQKTETIVSTYRKLPAR